MSGDWSPFWSITSGAALAPADLPLGMYPLGSPEEWADLPDVAAVVPVLPVFVVLDWALTAVWLAWVLPLPMIRNRKTVDPRNKNSTPVYQLETAMGAAIECFDGSLAIEVPRSRFAPVKTTGDLLALRSDAYDVLDNGQVLLAASRQGQPPVISLSDDYKLVDSLDELGVPGLLRCQSLKVEGRVHFEPGVVVEGDVSFVNHGPETRVVAAGAYS